MTDAAVPLRPTQNDDDQPAPSPRITVQLVNNPAGAQKTRSFCALLGEQYRANPAGLHTIVAAPTYELLKDYAGDPTKPDKPGYLHDPLVGDIPKAVVRVISRLTGKKTVRMQLRAYLERQPPNEPSVLLVTHAGMMLERPAEWDDNPSDKKNIDPRTGEFKPRRVWNPLDWDLVWDEAPDVLTFHHLECPFTHRLWTRLVSPVPYRKGLLQLRPTNDLQVWDADEREYMSYEGDKSPKDFLMNVARQQPPDMGQKYAAKLCAAIANPQKLVAVLSTLEAPVLSSTGVVEAEEVVDGQWEDLLRGPRPKAKDWLRGELDLMEITMPNAYGAYRSMTIMGARLEQTMCMVLWRRLFDIHTVKHPLSERLPDAHQADDDRLEVFYVWENRASRTWLRHQGKSGDSLFKEAAAAIASILQIDHDKLVKAKKGQGELPMWNAPIYGAEKEHGVSNDFFKGDTDAKKHYQVKRNWYDADMRLPGKSQGLNRPEFLDCRTVALLSVLRYAPNHYEILARLGVTAEEIDSAFQFNSNYQDILRCNIRVPKGNPAYPVIHSKTGREVMITPSGKVRVYLFDKPSALDFASSFPKLQGKVTQIPANLVPEPAREQPKKRVEGQAAMSPAERARKWREQQKANRAHAAERAQRMAERQAEEGDAA